MVILDITNISVDITKIKRYIHGYIWIYVDIYLYPWIYPKVCESSGYVLLKRGTNQKQKDHQPPVKLEKKVKQKKCQSAPPAKLLKIKL